jgi:hypothetical protein
MQTLGIHSIKHPGIDSCSGLFSFFSTQLGKAKMLDLWMVSQLPGLYPETVPHRRMEVISECIQEHKRIIPK